MEESAHGDAALDAAASPSGAAPHDSPPSSHRAPVPVLVMLPLDTVDADGAFRYAGSEWFSGALRRLKSTGVHGVAVDVWWGAVERAPRRYDWFAYRELFRLVASLGLRIQAVMSFHACGGNIGDDASVPLPDWALGVGDRDPDIFFADRPRGSSPGQRNRECLSWHAEEEPGLLKGRSILECYADFMRAFRDEFVHELGPIIEEVVIGCGPCGELRYPSYPEPNGWRFPGIGEFQCFDRRSLASLAQAAMSVGHPEWGASGPMDAGSYNSNPDETVFFRGWDGGWQSPYGRFFLEWYSNSLIEHGDRMLSIATSIFWGDGNGKRKKGRSRSDATISDAVVSSASPQPITKFEDGTLLNPSSSSTGNQPTADRPQSALAQTASLSFSDWDAGGCAMGWAQAVPFSHVQSNQHQAFDAISQASRMMASLRPPSPPSMRRSRTVEVLDALRKTGHLPEEIASHMGSVASASELAGSTNSTPGPPRPPSTGPHLSPSRHQSNSASLSPATARMHHERSFASLRSSLSLEEEEQVGRADAPLQQAQAPARRQNLSLSIKIAGVHWWYQSPSHAAELTAGYYNVLGHDGYEALCALCARHGVAATLTCVEMCDAQHPPQALCGPEGVLRQVREAAARWGVPLGGENALPCFRPNEIDAAALERMAYNTGPWGTPLEQQQQNGGSRLSETHAGEPAQEQPHDNSPFHIPAMRGCTFLRLTREMMSPSYQEHWREFVEKMNHNGDVV